MSNTDQPSAFFIVRHGRVGRDVRNPMVATIRLSADRDIGPHMDFVADASTLDRIADLLKQAATDIRKRAS